MRRFAAPPRLALLAAPLLVGSLGLSPASAAPPSGALPPPPAALQRVRLETVVTGLEEPVGLVAWPGRPRLLVVERGGKVRVVEVAAAGSHLAAGKLAPAPLLDLGKRVRTRHSEQGLLGLALHPQFAQDRRLYVDFTDLKGDTHVVEIKLDAADLPGAERELLFVKQPYGNHNGGELMFGPDGKLYVGLGDGGAGYDPHGNGQDKKTQLGKMLRIDVDSGAVETAMLGLRNPWRYAFDRKSGDLYIADVGQDRWEEIDVLPAEQVRGAAQPNFGWSVREGRHCLKGDRCETAGFVEPVAEYSHKVGCSVTGGYVYRGAALPELDGLYFYTDYCTAIIRTLRWKAGKIEAEWDWRGVLDPESKLAKLSTFGEDEAGELYLVSLEGTIYKLTRRP